MDNLLIRPVLPEKISSSQVEHNVRMVLQEISDLKLQPNSFVKTPTYKTVRQFLIEEVFFLFGLKKTSLFRLTQSEYSQFLPKVIVIYCNADQCNEEAPVIIEDKLFISASYFEAWIDETDSQKYENQMLEVIMSKLEFKAIRRQ